MKKYENKEVRPDELILSLTFQVNAIINILEKKDIASKKEIMEEIVKIRMELLKQMN